MRKTTAVLVVVMVMVQMFCVPVLSYGEEEPSGRPSYQERAAHTFMNAARVDPLGYKATYMSGYGDNTANLFATSTYKIVPPLYYDSNLTNVANLHSADMATNNCFKHDSCNGTPTFTRIGLYYTCPGAKAENIAAGNKDALDSISQWLCDSVNGACAVDNSANDGHRKNIMSASYKVAGNGYATRAGSQWTHYWTQDFGGGSCNKYTSPVYGGTHRVTKSPAQTKFFAVYYTNPAVAPSSAIVNIDGTDYSLTREIGVAGNGVYVFSQSSGTGCRNYYFKFGSVRYPDTGFLVTYGEGSCVTSFVAGSSSVASSSSVSSTTTTSSSSTSSTPSTSSIASTASTSATTSVASSSVSSSTTTTTTTRPVSTSTASTSSVSTTSGTTGSSGRYVIYSSGLKDSWTLYTNRGATTNAAVSFAGRTAIRADLTGASGTNFFMLRRTPTVPNVYSTIKFSVAAADANTKLFFYVNGGYAKSYTLTSSWTDVSVSLAKTSVGVDLPNLGNPVFVFSNGESTAETFYISEIYVE